MCVKRPHGARESAMNQFCFGPCFSAASQRSWTQRSGSTWSPSCLMIGLLEQERLALLRLSSTAAELEATCKTRQRH